MNRENNVNSHILLYIQNTGVRFYGKCPLWLQCFVFDLRSFPCAFQFIRGAFVFLQGSINNNYKFYILDLLSSVGFECDVYFNAGLRSIRPVSRVLLNTLYCLLHSVYWSCTSCIYCILYIDTVKRVAL